jgi:predicted nucleic acid-binding protein
LILTETNSTADKIFLDTNILVYMYSKDEPVKQIIASELILNDDSEYVISTQVIGEFINILSRKFKYGIQDIKVAVDDFRENFEVGIIKTDTIDTALFIMGKYRFSYWDSMIVSSALNKKCNILYSEDLQHEQIVEKELKIINPFE